MPENTQGPTPEEINSIDSISLAQFEAEPADETAAAEEEQDASAGEEAGAEVDEAAAGEAAGEVENAEGEAGEPSATNAQADELAELMELVEQLGGKEQVRILRDNLAPELKAAGGIENALSALREQADAQARQKERDREQSVLKGIESHAEQIANIPIHRRLAEAGYDPADRESYIAAFQAERDADPNYAVYLQAQKAIALNAYRERLQVAKDNAQQFNLADPDILAREIAKPDSTADAIRELQQKSHEHTSNAVSAVTRERDALKAELESFKAGEAKRIDTARKQGQADAAAQLKAVRSKRPTEGSGEPSSRSAADPYAVPDFDDVKAAWGIA
jgi:hypothetical protein